MKAAPCKDCETRTPPDCHVGCKRYNDWKDERKVGEAEKQRERDASPVLCRKVQKQIWKYKKWR